ncbi:MAG: SprT-like domain-containing protein [Chloroflexi bacterium]|nr:SprT-like domain-containing protein [Chloroflexota bacterium]
MDRLKDHGEKTFQSAAQIALPGFESPSAPVPFDPLSLIQDTFRLLAPNGVIPVVEVSRRMLRTLGSFTPTKNLIRLSSRLLALGSMAEQRHVVLHEVAHAIVHHRTPEARAHGREFRSVCDELGLVAGRFVKIDHAVWHERLRFAVDCPACGGTILRRRRVNKVRCGCGTSVRPRVWAAVAITETGAKPL